MLTGIRPVVETAADSEAAGVLLVVVVVIGGSLFQKWVRKRSRSRTASGRSASSVLSVGNVLNVALRRMEIEVFRISTDQATDDRKTSTSLYV
jgi:hypothetical protein